MKNDIATKIVDEIFEDLRDRRFLKWLFDNAEENIPIAKFYSGETLYNLDFEVQTEIKKSWAKIIRKRLK